MAKRTPRLELRCPKCQAKLVVERETGLVLHSEEQKPNYSLEEAVTKIKSQKDKSDELFQKALVDERRRQAGLEEKFHKAFESRDELDEPVRPFDLD